MIPKLGALRYSTDALYPVPLGLHNVMNRRALIPEEQYPGPQMGRHSPTEYSRLST
jgi:hypothetical protein